MKNSGFTLIELLIVVSIIIVLSVAGMVIYSSVFSNGRDQARQKDLSIIRQALELYRADQHIYPTSVSFGGILQSPGGTVYLGDEVRRQYVPQDSKSGQSYAYRAYADTIGGSGCDNTTTFCKAYVLCAKKEGTSSPPCPVLNLSCGTGLTCDMGIASN